MNQHSATELIEQPQWSKRAETREAVWAKQIDNFCAGVGAGMIAETHIPPLADAEPAQAAQQVTHINTPGQPRSRGMRQGENADPHRIGGFRFLLCQLPQFALVLRFQRQSVRNRVFRPFHEKRRQASPTV